MIISELFKWLHDDEEFLHLSNQPISQDLLKLEQSEANKINRMLLSKVRLAKLSGLETSDALSKLEQHILFMDYLEFCGQQFVEDTKGTLFLITLKYLLSKSQKENLRLNTKLNELFSALLQEDKDNALSFYKQNEALFKNYPEIQKRVELELHEQKHEEAVKRVENHLAHLSKQLSNQKNPLGIIGLCRDWVSDSEQFAALILWLLEQNISTKQILQTYILHDFLKYHLFTLHSEDNEIFHLYKLLNHFPQAKLLVETAKQTASDERGFQQYALNGILSERELQSIPRIPQPLKFSLTATNFLALHELFGQDFLVAAVVTSVNQKNSKWLEVLHHTLNEPERITDKVPNLIRVIAHEFSPKILENLAGLIDDDTAQQLLSNNEGAVFYLLPYKPKLYEYINKKNVTEFIHQITLRNTSDPEIIFQLMALFSILPKKKNSVTQLVFQAIIDRLVEHPLLLEDEKLLHQLRKYPDCEQILAQQSKKIKQQVNDCLIEQTSESPFSRHNYQVIEDVWLDATRKLTVFNLIKPQAKFDLEQKYAFQAKIAQTAFLYDRDNFNLDAFIEALSLPPVNAEDGVSEYERILIEILAVIDNELIREQVIGKLENSPVKRLNWVEKEYEGETIFLKAAKYGNLGLMTLLKDQTAPEVFNKAIITAAKANQWKIVDSFCQLDKVQLNREELKEIILMAAGQGQLKIIPYDYEPTSNELIQIFNQAINHGRLNVIEYFYTFSGNMPNQSVINKLFNLAINLEHWDIALFIADSEKHAPSLLTIEKAFNQVANDMELEAIQGFCNLSTNAPRPNVIHRAFIKASQLGHLPVVQSLHNLPEKLPRTTIEDAMEQAIINGHMKVFTYLYNSLAYPPNKYFINQCLMTALKSGRVAFVEFFCSMTAKYKPTQHAYDQSIYWTIKHNQVELFITLCRSELNSPSKLAMRKSFLLGVKEGKLEIVDYLCRNEMDSLNQHTVDEALLLAVKHKNTKIAQYLCDLPTNAPQLKSLKIAFKTAVSTGQTELADYLSEYLRSKKSPQKKIDPEIDYDSANDTISEIDILSENGLEIENKPGNNQLGPEINQESDMNQTPGFGIPLKTHGLFKVTTQRDTHSISSELTGGIVLD